MLKSMFESSFLIVLTISMFIFIDYFKLIMVSSIGTWGSIFDELTGGASWVNLAA